LEGNSVVTLHNFDERPQEACLRIAARGQRLSDLVNPLEISARKGCFAVPLDSLGYRWFRVGGLDYAVRGGRR
jgi:maltose alpha-D-glucosyltransferase/alpha-amylase